MALMPFTTSTPAPSGLALRLPVVALLVCLALGCENPNEAFSGLWGPSESIDPADSSIDLGAGPVWPQLHLGHYGLEGAGVATFHPTELVTGPTSTCVENDKPPAEAGDLVDQSVEGWRQRDFSASMRAGITL